jgi:hypothetical protein
MEFVISLSPSMTTPSSCSSTATLVINALGGSDEIALSTPAQQRRLGHRCNHQRRFDAADGDVLIVSTPGDAPETSTFTRQLSTRAR